MVIICPEGWLIGSLQGRQPNSSCAETDGSVDPRSKGPPLGEWWFLMWSLRPRGASSETDHRRRWSVFYWPSASPQGEPGTEMAAGWHRQAGMCGPVLPRRRLDGTPNGCQAPKSKRQRAWALGKGFAPRPALNGLCLNPASPSIPYLVFLRWLAGCCGLGLR